MINVDDFGKSIRITGHPEQVAMEFEFVARAVRTTFCDWMGDSAGDAVYKEILAMAEKSEDEITDEYQRIRTENPELAEAFDHSKVMQDLRDCLGEE